MDEHQEAEDLEFAKKYWKQSNKIHKEIFGEK
jgi:hypothetical protein